MGDLFAPSHILLLVIVALLLFGPKKLPELGRAFGKSLRAFKEGARGIMDDDEQQPSDRKTVHEEPKQLPE